jgi:GT2 family glycosyltransferase
MSAPKVVVLGMMTKMPVAGVVWQTVHYLLGFERLGYEAHYVETHARTPSMLMARDDDDGAALAAGFIDATLRRFGLGDRWAYVALHDDGRHFGRTQRRLRRLYDDAELIVNLHGGTRPRPEFADGGRLVYLETDPVQLQVELAAGAPDTLAFLEPHAAFFTFAENLGNADCGLPVPAGFAFHPTRQPVVTGLWETPQPPAGRAWTTVGNWRQHWRDVQFGGQTYTWSKHHEWAKVLDLPARTGRSFELALSGCEEADRARLAGHGWDVADGLALSSDPDRYRAYVRDSRGELTVAKDQNVRLRTGWFSDRSATYLAAGRPVVTQDTGFGAALPTGEGLFAFTGLDDAAAAVEEVERAPARHRAAAAAIAREHFEAATVLGEMLDTLGLRARPARSLPVDLELTPVARRPLRLAEDTARRIADLPPAGGGIPASVVVVTYGEALFTKLCLESVLANTATPGHEVVVVDNGSTAGAREYLAGLERAHVHVRVLLNERNAGFAAANNQGLAAARGDALVLLNNDTIVAPGWLDGLLRHLDDPRLGLVGAVTNRSGTAAEIPAPYRTYGELRAFAADRARRWSGRTRELATPTMFCLALRRETYERLGPLDERFEVGMLEDDDYARRAADAGLACVCAEDVFVHHFGEASFGALVPTGEHARVLAANKRRYEEKWGEPWQPYDRRPDPAYDVAVERTRTTVEARTPLDAAVAVVSRGDERLVELGHGRSAWHFPLRGDGRWAGHHPADSASAVRELEAVRERGARFLVFPRTAFWWLDFYEGMTRHLQRTGRTVAADEDCIIFELGAGRG